MKLGFSEQSAPQGIVFGGGKLFFVTDAVFFQDRVADQRGRMNYAIVEQKLALDLGVGFRVADDCLRPDNLGSAGNDPDVWVAVEEIDFAGKALGQRNVVVIHDRKVFALSFIEQNIAGSGNSEIGFVFEIFYAGIGI